MKSISKKTACAFAAFCLSLSVYAEIKMPNIFSDNMMLQRDEPAKIWGSAEPNAEVGVEFNANKVKAKANEQGKWSLHLPKMSASAEPKTLKVFENGKLEKEISNVVVGEIWIASGQSNMEWVVALTNTADEAKKTANYPQIRYFRQRGDFASAEPLDDCVKGRWVKTTPSEVMSYSAVGFYFAERLTKELDVPVGIVYAALGATPMNVWLPSDKLGENEGLKIDVKNHAKRMEGYDYAALHAKWEAERDAYRQARAKAVAEKTTLPKPSGFVQNEPIPEDPKGPRQLPSGSFNAKIAPIVGYTVRGVIWYQGESDSYDHRLANYEHTFSLLINTWRDLWGDKSMPFYFVQLTSYDNKNRWEETRQAQADVAKKLKNVEMAVILDIGEKKQIHPATKKPVGVRLANLVLKYVYDKDVVYPKSPEFKSIALNGDTAVVALNAGGRKLECRGEPRGFEVKSEKGDWLNATAYLKGETIVLKSPSAEKITAARYLWKAWAGDDVCIFNQDGLPAAPFSSDRN